MKLHSIHRTVAEADLSQELLRGTQDLGGDSAEAAGQVRQQLRQQQELQRQEDQRVQKRLDPKYRKLEQSQADIEAIGQGLQQAQQSQAGLVGQLGKAGPQLGRALRDLKQTQMKL